MKRRIYLTLERARDIALRNLFRKVFVAGSFEEAKEGQLPVRRTRIPVTEFAAAMRIGSGVGGGVRTDLDEVECFLANLIYKVGKSLSMSNLMWCCCLSCQAITVTRASVFNQQAKQRLT